jgi:hypothetical protein
MLTEKLEKMCGLVGFIVLIDWFLMLYVVLTFAHLFFSNAVNKAV